MIKYFGLAFVGLLAIGCASNAAKTSNAPASPEGCDTRRQAVVTNNWSEPVDVFTRIGSTPTRIFVGTVRAGQHEQFRLPSGARYVYLQEWGSTDAHAALPAASQQLVDVRYLCE